MANAIATTIIAAVQPVITRYGATNIDPMLFCAGSMTVAGSILAVVMWRRGEIGTLVSRQWTLRLIALSLAGSVATSLTLIFGLRRIDAIAGVILLQSEPLYSLLLSTIFLGERPSRRQLIATAVILIGIGSVLGGGQAFRPFSAAVLLLLTPLCWQTSHVISLGVMPPLSEICVTGARTIFAAIVLVTIFLVTRFRRLEHASRTAHAAGDFRDRRVYLRARFAHLVRRNQPAFAGMDDGADDSGRADARRLYSRVVFLGEHPSSARCAGC